MIFKRKIFDKNVIFVIGSGRSGTHLLGRTLGSVQEIDAFIEDKKFFARITNLAVNPNRPTTEIKAVLELYKKEFSKSTKDYILEKSHPNIWLVEDILKEFNTAKFIGIRRDVYATVASMLNHPGILKWYDELPQDEINNFLGITAENVSYFDALPIESKCALRWKSHLDRLNALERELPNNVLVINYEDFYDSSELLNTKMNTFLNTNFNIQAEPLNPDGKEKWKKTLTDAHIANINKTLGLHN